MSTFRNTTCTFFLLCALTSHAAESKVRHLTEITFAEVDGLELKLDLHLPVHAEKPPLVVFMHGGGWQGGSRQAADRFAFLPEEGFALASIDYRLAPKGVFPDQIHDCKGAIRWLRAQADSYGYDASKVAVMGTSAGATLALLVGTSGDVAELEGTVGGNLDQSSRVQAIADYYGPSDLELRARTHPERSETPGKGTYLYIGGSVAEKPEVARQASPVTHVTPDDPPLLIFHGTRDTTVQQVQAERIRDAYQELSLPIELILIPDGKHGGKAFWSGENREKLVAFLRLQASIPFR